MDAPAARTPQPRILLVEDDGAVRGIAGRVLREAGYYVAEASDGVQGWAQFQRQPGFDLLLADVVMPRMAGTELAARVHAVRPALPILLMSGYTPGDLLARGLEAAHGTLVTKPFKPETLLGAVQRALESGA